MSYEEVEIDARLLEIVDLSGGFENIDDEELVELVEQISQFHDGDFEETYEYLLQFAPIDEKRFLSLCL